MGKIIKPVIAAGLALPVVFTGYSLNNSSKRLEQTGNAAERTVMAKEVKTKTGFTGAEWTKEDEEKYALYKGSKDICADRDNGGIYYVNWYYDNYLYYWKDGETRLVLDKWVSQICYMDGYVYCIYDETGKTYDANITPSYEGKICSFNVKTGEFKELSETKAKTLAVCKDGLYYAWFTGPDAKEQKEEYGFYSFSDNKIHKSASRQENGTNQQRYGKYAAVYRDNACNLRNLEDGSEQVLIPGSENVTNIRIINDKCYYNTLDNEKFTFNVIDLKNGKKKRLRPGLNVSDMVQLNNSSYLYTGSCHSGDMLVYDPVKDEVKKIRVKNTYSAPTWGYTLEWMHTDGVYLYTLASSMGICSTTGTGMVVIKADGMDISEVWSSLEYDDIKNGR